MVVSFQYLVSDCVGVEVGTLRDIEMRSEMTPKLLDDNGEVPKNRMEWFGFIRNYEIFCLFDGKNEVGGHCLFLVFQEGKEPKREISNQSERIYLRHHEVEPHVMFVPSGSKLSVDLISLGPL